MIFWNIQLPVSTGRRGHIGVMSVHEMSHREISLRWCKDCKNIFCGSWDMIFFNIKLWFSVIRYLMTSSWRHNACFFYLLCSKYMPSFKFVCSLQVCVFLSTIYRPKRKKKKKKKKKKTRDWCLYWQTLGVREERKVKLGSILFTSLKIQTMLKLRNTLPLEYFFFSTSGLDRK